MKNAKTHVHRRARKRHLRKKLTMLACGITLGVSGMGASSKATGSGIRTSSKNGTANFSRAAWPKLNVQGPRPEVVDLALSAASCAIRSGMVDQPRTLTIIDYSKPSTERRLWVMDFADGSTLRHELVAHGQGSGGDLANAFSNTADSHQSSLGLFVTSDTYVGKNGYSLRLDGLDTGFNDNARERAIVIHGAPYVSESVARAQGRLGRSWGCPALGEDVARSVIEEIKGGNLVFAYYPDRSWLNGSPLLRDCNAAADVAGD